MAGGRRQAAFRPAATESGPNTPSPRQAIALVAVLVLIAAVIAVASFTVKPSKARAFDLFYGSMFINDDTAPVAIDLASGKPTVRLPDAYRQVNAQQPSDVDAVPLAGGTLLLDTVTGEFNIVDSTGLVARPGGGVSIGKASAASTSTGLASGDSAYIVRTGTSGTSAYLVSLATVTSSLSGGQIKPRASAAMSEQVGNVATSTVTANGDLWLLAGPASSRTIRQLSVPKGSNPGVTLKTTDHGSVGGVSALGVSTANSDGSGGDVVAAATADSIEIFGAAGGDSHRLSVRAPSGVDVIMPATNLRGSLAFLYHSSSGWSIVRAPANGSGSAQVQPLDGVDAAANLAVPAQSDGSLYTADRSSGALWQIGESGHAAAVPGVSRYPLVAGETSTFSQVTASASGARVIFNSRARLKAVTVFTDGSHKPLVNDKRTAVEVTADGAAAALSNLRPNTPKPVQGPPKPRPDPPQQVTDKIDCKTAKQIPHIPNLELVDRAARSVQLSWTYPLLDRQDCAPSTYTVSVRLLGGNAPPAPQTVTVQGQTGVNLVGLFPDTEYEIVLTAYINGAGTPSAPLSVRTSVEGPAAPTNVQAVPDENGNWAVSWNSCGGIANSCVPAANWTVIPQLCDNEGGLTSAPANLHVVGDPTTHSFSAVYKGNGSLLGRGLDFQVAGVGLKGTTGTTSKASSCTYSWSHPIASNIHVAAAVTTAAYQGTTTTKVAVTFDGDQNVDLGGVRGQLTYELLRNGSIVSTVGPTSQTNVSLDGVQPGQSYAVRVRVSPPLHPSASVSLPSVDVSTSAQWPALVASASFAGTDSSNGILTVDITGVTSRVAGNERFDLVDDPIHGRPSQLLCGSTRLPLHATGFDPAKSLTFPVDRSEYNGVCSVTVSLVENSGTVSGPAYFGDLPSDASQDGSVNIPVPTLTVGPSDFTASFASSGVLGVPAIGVTYSGGDPLIETYASDWNSQAQFQTAPSSPWTNCGPESTASLVQGTSLDISSCYYTHQSAKFRVTVGFTYFGQTASGIAVPVNGNGPAPVDASQMKFSAQWSDLGPNAITVTNQSAYSDATLSQLTWTETVTSGTNTCTVTNSSPSNQIAADASFFTKCPATTFSPPAPATYQVVMHFEDPHYHNTGDFTVTVSGTPQP